MSAVAVIREGHGPEILLVHGGASPRTTWGALAPLAERWTLAHVHRRGYPPSPPPDVRQDFEVDAADLEPLLASRPHVVAHSYGTLGALYAALRAPGRVRSLTIIEPPLAHLLDDDEEAARFVRLGDAFLAEGPDMDPARLREFLRIAGAPDVGDGPLSPEVAAGVRRAHGGRAVSEADPPLERIRAAGIPALVASGDHFAVGERICDHVAGALGAERLVAPGAGHFVAAAPGFAPALERFLQAY